MYVGDIIELTKVNADQLVGMTKHMPNSPNISPAMAHAVGTERIIANIKLILLERFFMQLRKSWSSKVTNNLEEGKSFAESDLAALQAEDKC
jgi:hypothetical protein